MQDGLLKDKIMLVMGGTGGLGLSGALAIVRAGGRVVAVGRDADGVAQAAAKLGDSGRAVTGDASQSGVAESAIDLAVRTWGRLDGLYHVAGGSGRRMGDGPLHELTDEGWEQTLRLNLTSMFYSSRAAVRQFLQQDNNSGQTRGGTVLNMGSVLGWSPSPRYFGTLAYATAKSAIVGMSRSAAAAYAPQNIRFNVVAPALVETPMAQRAAGDQQIMDFIRTKQPLDGGRIGQPSDVDSAVVYLLSDQARFVTGQVLAVDGGWCVSEGQY